MYYLYAIYDDQTTRLGTFANRTFEGSDINRVIRNFKKEWFGVTDRGHKIIGVEVEICQRKFDDGVKKRIFFGGGSEKI